jgi:hypothetical protein
MNTQIQAMRKLGLTKEEIAEVLEADKMIDQGVKLFEVTAEQEKASKQARQADRKPRAYDLDNTGGKRNKKADDDKRFLIDTFVWALTTDTVQNGDNVCAENVNIINPEREVEFTYNERKFKITLSAPRT